MTQHQINKIKIIMEHYGIQSQREIFVEECAEAIQAVQKCKRASDYTYARDACDNLNQEVADVLITAYQMRLFLGKEEIDRIINEKLDRQIMRIRRRYRK